MKFTQIRAIHTVSAQYARHSHAKFDLRAKADVSDLLKQPSTPIRARFAPSPTGFLHLGSLRTALYNYLAARSTGGTFMLRLEDTDQKRLVQGAEQNIYDTLAWLGMRIDEGPPVGGPHEPYRQSERSEIYRKYADDLLERGLAYRCFCPKERLDQLRDSARRLKPPTTASYDRQCLKHLSKEESDARAHAGESFTVRFQAPDRYPSFIDLLHGPIDQQIQFNPVDRRYDDPVLMKSDGLPTYHFANVIDDHLMNITHVIRGEEWLASTPKHVALYDAFGWTPPKFIHIPLLTTVDNRKLSKRSGDIDIMSLKSKGYLPEALVNFSVLFGWSPKREYGQKASELFSLGELEKLFSLEGLTKGSAKVDFKKLEFFNKHYLSERLKHTDTPFYTEFVDKAWASVKTILPDVERTYVSKVVHAVSGNISRAEEMSSHLFSYFFVRPVYSKDELAQIGDLPVLANLLSSLHANVDGLTSDKLGDTVKVVAEEAGVKRKVLYQTLRYALSGPEDGTRLTAIVDLLGSEEVAARLISCQDFINS